MVAGQASVWAVVAQARPALPAEEQKKWFFWGVSSEEEERVERSIMLPMPLFGVLVTV